MLKYVDFHCDTASELLYTKSSLNKNKLSNDINKMKKGGALAQFFAFFINAGETNDLFLEFEVMYKNFINEVNKNKNSIKIVTNVKELQEAENENKIGAFLSIEEGDVLEGNFENIDKVYDMGIRIITLTWNYKNKIGYPNYNFLYKDNGLTDLGIEMVIKMEDKGIIPDVSHLSDKGFYDVAKICKKPFIATHSNGRAITNHPRNLTDDMIKILANKGGVMGLNFCSDFLGKSKISKIDDMIKHINHIRNVGGIDCIALGSDFDGIENKVEIKDASEMPKLEMALIKNGYSYDDIEKIYYKNALRILKENLKE